VSQQQKKRTGRPKLPKEKSLSKFISTRLLPQELQEIEEAIKRNGKSKTTWVRGVLLDAARKL
jgi:hypothetical protein